MKRLHINFGLVFRLLKNSATTWVDDNAMRLSAALSYYSIFSIAPLLLIAIGIVGLVFGQEAASGKIAVELGKFVGWEAAKSVQDMVQSASKSGGSATLVGFVVLFFGASSVFGQLKEALNTIWGVRPKSGLGIWGFLRERLLSFGMVLVIGFLLLVSLGLSTAMAAMGGWMEGALHLPKFVSATFGFLLPLAVETLLFALVFRILPDAKIRWRCVGLGAFVTALLFEIGKSLLAWYLGQASTTSSFGAAGSLVVLLLWVFYASCILFFGAEFTKIYAAEAKMPIEPSDIAEKVPSADSTVIGAPVKVGVDPHPLHPEDRVPHLPMKESLAPLLASTMIEPEVLRATRLPKRLARPVPQTRWKGWMETANEHPVAQIGAAVGVGLLAGAISRAMEKNAPAMTAGDHFAEGSRKTVKAGRSLAAVGLAWAARHLTKKALRSYGDTARETGARWTHVLAERVEKAIR